MIHDVCIIGSGVAGLMIADKIKNAYPRICIVESGARRPEDYYQELNRCDLVINNYDPVESRARAHGGSMHLWAGRCGMLDEADFRERSWVPLSGWPILFQDMKPHYQSALDMFGSGLSVSDLLQDQSALDLGIPDHDLKTLAILDHVDTRYVENVLMKVIKERSNITFIEKTTVLSLETLDGKNISHIKAVRNGRKSGVSEAFDIHARLFVVACGGIETPRLLLASSSWFHEGIGNQSGNVGRYFSDHPRFRSANFKLAQNSSLARAVAGLPRTEKKQIAFRLTDSAQKEHQLLNHSFTLSESSGDIEVVASDMSGNSASKKSVPYLKGKARLLWRKLPPDFRSLLKKFISKRKSEKYCLVFKIECTPNFSSRISLSHHNKDRNGSNLPVIDWRLSEIDRSNILKYFDILKKYIDDSGIIDGELRLPDRIEDAALRDSSHPMGATRMSSSPEMGVVDKDLRVFDVSNLYICSSSVFPTPGNVNPTLTIAALAARLAEALCALPKQANAAEEPSPA